MDRLHSGDTKRSFALIKEYFPAATSQPKVLELRTKWHELIINKAKREFYFENQFRLEYDEKFFNVLLLKTNAIIQRINKELPLTDIEEVSWSSTLKYHFELYPGLITIRRGTRPG